MTFAPASSRSPGSPTSGRSSSGASTWPKACIRTTLYLALQTLVGAWPLTRERLDEYLTKALREGKVRSGWLEPDEGYERSLQEAAWGLHDDVGPFVRRLAGLGARISLAQTLLKLTCPGVPDIYQGDELWSLNLVDPDNRRPVDWDRRRSALHEAASTETEKLHLIRTVLAARVDGAYEPVDAGADVCAFTRGGTHLVAVPLRPGASYQPPRAWRPVVPGLWARS